MGSAKTLNLLAVAHSYQSQNKKVLILKPRLDTRFGEQTVRSRSGLEKPADILLDTGTKLDRKTLENISCLLVDEAQFLSTDVVEHLREITTELDIPVICYGLRSDFKTNLFEGSKRLLELADNIEEVKSTCHYCNKKAVFNIRLVNGKIAKEGPSIQLGAEETYLPICPSCFSKKLKEV